MAYMKDLYLDICEKIGKGLTVSEIQELLVEERAVHMTVLEIRQIIEEHYVNMMLGHLLED